MITQWFYESSVQRFHGLSTDTKPTDCTNGSVFVELDTAKIYLFNEASLTWHAIPDDNTGDYNDLSNKPSINGVTLSGNKSLADIGLVNPLIIKGRVDSESELPSNAQTGWVYFVGLTTDEELDEYVYTVDGEWELLGTSHIMVDSALSTTSENPVQNKVITNAMVGEKTTGKQYVIDGQTVTAGDGAEVFNDYTNNKAAGKCSHAEGSRTSAIGNQSHAEGTGTTASGNNSHVEGQYNTASGNNAHAEGGGGVNARGSASHAEGSGTDAIGINSHAEGSGTQATGDSSHTEGDGTKAIGQGSHSEGWSTVASSNYQHVQGQYNVSDSNGTYAFIIGNGTYNARHNAFAIDWNGNIYVNGSATGVNVETLSSTLTPISESAYEALTTKDKPLYFIYD